MDRSAERYTSEQMLLFDSMETADRVWTAGHCGAPYRSLGFPAGMMDLDAENRFQY